MNTTKNYLFKIRNNHNQKIYYLNQATRPGKSKQPPKALYYFTLNPTVNSLDKLPNGRQINLSKRNCFYLSRLPSEKIEDKIPIRQNK